MDRIDTLVNRLRQSTDVCRQRLGREMESLLGMLEGQWSNRVRLDGIRATEDNGLMLTLVLANVQGLICEDGEVRPQSTWVLDIEFPRSYPHHAPSAWLRGPGGEKAFNPHAVHPDQLISELDLTTTDQRAFVGALKRKEQGRMCFLDRWSPDWHTRNLLIVVFQLSRCITGTSFHSEQFALNREARDFYLRARKQGQLPFGPPLSHPWSVANDRRAETLEEADFEFVEESE